MGELKKRLMDVLGQSRLLIKDGDDDDFEAVEKDLRERPWLKCEESNPAKVKHLGRAAIKRAESVRRADALFDELQEVVAGRDREATLEAIERTQASVQRMTV